jgi:hypothetical protein
MRSIDEVLRAQARALITVLGHYKLLRACGGNRPRIWRDVEAFGTGRGTEVDLQSIGRNNAGTTAAAFCFGIKHQAPNAAVHLALATFTGFSFEHRLLEPSRWIALALVFMDKRSTPGSEGHCEVFSLLESVLDTEITAEAGRGQEPEQLSLETAVGQSLPIREWLPVSCQSHCIID